MYEHLLEVGLREPVRAFADFYDQGLDHVLLQVVGQHLLLQAGHDRKLHLDESLHPFAGVVGAVLCHVFLHLF